MEDETRVTVWPTLEEYIRAEHARSGAIDFTFRANVTDTVEIYIHPQGRDGDTTATLLVEGDTVRVKPGQWRGVVSPAAQVT